MQSGGKRPPPHGFSQNNCKIKSRYIFIVTMDYVDKSDVEVFTMKLTLVLCQRENGFHSKWPEPTQTPHRKESWLSRDSDQGPSCCEATVLPTEPPFLPLIPIEDCKNVAWSDESRFLPWHSDGRVRICHSKLKAWIHPALSQQFRLVVV